LEAGILLCDETIKKQPYVCIFGSRRLGDRVWAELAPGDALVLTVFFQAGDLSGVHLFANLQEHVGVGLFQVGAGLRDSVNLRE
jgi:hypothetical protein